MFDVLVGINLLREGLDIPECALVAILDADKEGFLRSQHSLIQTIAAPRATSMAAWILVADTLTNSLRNAIEETKQAAQQAARLDEARRHHAGVDQAADRQGAGERVEQDWTSRSRQ